MFCGYCGQQIRDDAKFCCYCGNSCVAAQPDAPAAPEPEPTNWISESDWAATQILNEQEPAEQSQPTYQAYPQQTWQPPVENPYASYVPRAAKQPKEKAVYPKSSFGLRLVSFLLCIFVFLFAFCAILQGAVRSTLSRKSMEMIIDNYDVKQINMRNNDGDAVPLLLYIEEVGGFSFRNDYDLNIADVEELANDSVCKEALKDWVLRYTEYYLNGTVFHPLTADEVADYLEDNAWRIMSISGFDVLPSYEQYYDYELDTYVRVTSPDNTRLADELFRQIETTPGNGIDKGCIDKLAGFNTKLISFGLSLLLLIILSALTVLLLVLLGVLNKKRMHSFFTYFGVTLIVLGSFTMLLGGGGLIVLAIDKNGLIQLFANPLLIKLLIAGGAVLLLGLLVMLLGRSACDSKWRKQKAYDEWMKNNNPPQPEPVA